MRDNYVIIWTLMTYILILYKSYGLRIFYLFITDLEYFTIFFYGVKWDISNIQILRNLAIFPLGMEIFPRAREGFPCEQFEDSGVTSVADLWRVIFSVLSLLLNTPFSWLCGRNEAHGWFFCSRFFLSSALTLVLCCSSPRDACVCVCVWMF